MPDRFALRPAPRATAVAPELDASQRAVVEHTGGPLLVLAGPGTGKTTTLVELVVDRIQHHGVAPERALVLTFSRKAAGEIGTRIARRLDGSDTAVVRTFHSLCFGLVNDHRLESRDVLRLVNSPEQIARIAELLAGHRAADAERWPASLRAAAQTRGFARELADFMSRAAAVGVEPEDVAAWGAEHGIAEWQSLAAFIDEYTGVFSLAGEADYASLVVQATALLDDPVAGDEIRNRFDLVVVDEYQDTDPAQVRLLQLLTGRRTPLVAVGDPDQSIYAFRGADVGGVWRFAEDFGTAARPASTLALRHTRRFGQVLLDASRRIIAPIGVAGRMDAAEFRAFRHPATTRDDPGSLEVATFASAAAEAETIAQILRRAHLDDGLDYAQMAVLTRTTGEAFGRLSRALLAAGVPVEVAGDEIPLHEEPAVSAVMLAARIVIALAEGSDVTPAEATDLLLGPLGGLDAGQMRRLSRHLRRIARAESAQARPSAELLVAAVADPHFTVSEPDDHPTRELVRRVTSVVDLLHRTAQLVRDRAPAEQVLWALWDGTGWPQRLRSATEAGGDEARSAHRDLDAICALFDRAARDAESDLRRPIGSFLDDLAAQEIPGDSLSETGIRPGAVRLMTAHRAKGLQWELVIVAGVNEGVWPQTRVRGSLLRTEGLGRAGLQPAPGVAEIVREERRLFYVAMTRAEHRLVVTATESPGEDGDQPSRFVEELAGFPAAAVGRRRRRPSRSMSLRGATATLRKAAEQGTTPRVRAAAARRLAALADVVPEAHPDRWWGLAEVTGAETPVRPSDEPLALSGSAVEAIGDCSLRWFLAREARTESASGAAQSFGSAVHVLAEVSVHDEQIDLDALLGRLDAVWDRISFEAPWIREKQRGEAHAAIRRYAVWHERDRGRTALAGENAFTVSLTVADDTVVLRGSMDRVELDDRGRVHVVDFKTSGSAPRASDIAAHAQLGVYQLAVRHGAVEGHAVPGGAELVQLRLPAGARDAEAPKVQAQESLDDQPEAPVHAQLAHAVRVVREEDFAATPSVRTCQFCDFRRVCPAQPEGASIVDGAP